MSKVLYIYQEKIEMADSLTEMFQEFAKNNKFITKLEDGKIYFDDTNSDFCEFYFLTPEKTKETLEKEVSIIREEMRKAVALMQSQGLKLAPAEMKKLKEQFAFLPEDKNAK